ncbi:MAG: hypothetical protein QNJ98_09105 [Planctomycetota bacterium]|nr:hypothetical protein [Planctomycetota bacterium]
MPRWTPACRLALLSAALLLTACDAGHRDLPGKDNKWGGPELAIQLPGPSTTVRYELTEDEWTAYKAGEHAPIQAMVHLRALNEVDEVVVRFAVDDRPFRSVPDPRKPFPLPAGLTPGTHLISAYAGNKSGEPHKQIGTKGVAVAEFHIEVKVTRADGTVDTLGGPSNTYGHQAEGAYQPFDRKAPQLLVDRRGAMVNVLVANGELAEDTLRVAWNDGESQMNKGVAGIIGLEDASTSISLTLEQMVDGEWQRVPGARSVWPMPRQ